jgi:choline dehydrogenase-like flavoprotein
MQERQGVRFPPGETVDFVIVGSGAAGGIIAKQLSTAGHTVIVLEQGPRLVESDFTHDEYGLFFLGNNTNAPTIMPQSFRSTPRERAVRQNALLYGRMVGGSNAHFTANFWRLRPSDFNEASVHGSVKGADLVDWPVTYEEMEPYYTMAEWELGVSGEPGPFDPPRSKPYPMPPLPIKSSGVLLENAAKKLGLHPQPTPMAINSQEYNGRPGCQHCGFCLAFMCEYRAKSTSMVAMLPVAEATGRCEIRPGSYVARVETDGRDRVKGVTYFDEARREQFQPARAVVLCANGAETPRLLLNSESTHQRHGLANSSGVVGKHLMFNTYYGVYASFEHPLNEYKSVQNTRMVLDFYETDPKRGFHGGGGIDARFGNYPITFALSAMPPDAPLWGSEFKKSMVENYTHTMFFGCHGTSLPVADNSVSIEPKLKDAWGLPCMRVTYRDHEDDLKCGQFLTDRAMEMAEAAGATKTWAMPVVPQNFSVHLLGTCRMGNDPKTSVVDRYHRTHDVRNLFICDGSSLVTSTRGQPTETISALAFRAGEHIADFARRGEI